MSTCGYYSFERHALSPGAMHHAQDEIKEFSAFRAVHNTLLFCIVLLPVDRKFHRQTVLQINLTGCCGSLLLMAGFQTDRRDASVCRGGAVRVRLTPPSPTGAMHEAASPIWNLFITDLNPWRI